VIIAMVVMVAAATILSLCRIPVAWRTALARPWWP
jgi:hypothetical protein